MGARTLKQTGIKVSVLVFLSFVLQNAFAQDEQRILLFTKTAGFYHGSIPAAVAAITNGAEANGYIVDSSNDADDINSENLENYDAVVFVMTSGDIFNETQQLAFEDFIRAGNGYAGIHSASDTEYDWAWYGDLVGAYFGSHPSPQEATLNIEDSSHPSMQGLGNPWVRTDEWYNFQQNPRANVNVLATLDESSYNGGNMGDHPIVWYHEFDGGRSWYTGGGHTTASYSDPDFVNHVLGGIAYAAGEVEIIDTDTDGINDSSDNCLTIANANQLDADTDGFGNLCDADINNDCSVNFIDYAFISSAFQSNDKDADLNGDGVVNFSDVFIFTQLYLRPPGPSALADCP